MNGHDRPVARLDAVTHRYGSVLALDDVTLDVPEGLVVGVIGPDGVGKSTLLSIVAGAKRIQRGRVQCLVATWLTSRTALVSARGSLLCHKGWDGTSILT